MSQDSRYISAEYIYKSLGLHARDQIDQCPPFTYLNLMNALERAENLLSSRYGTVIVNRDPTGTGTNNYFFTSPVITLAKLTYQSVPYRYAGLSDGSLYRRAANTQGQYTQILAPGALSGQPFSTIITNCINTAQPYLFIADRSQSLKDSGTFAAPELWGVDPPAYTLNTLPYSPLLTLIDNFASGNTYTTSNISIAFAAVDTFYPSTSQMVTDFPQFLNIADSATPPLTIAGGTQTASATRSSTPASADSIFSGFTSTPVTGNDSVTLSITFSGSVSGSGSGNGFISLLLSTDSGATFTQIARNSLLTGGSFGPTTITVAVANITNADQIQVELFVEAARPIFGPVYTITTSGTVSTITATISSPSLFSPITGGMLANIAGTATANAFAITTIASSGLSAGLYTTLTITTQTAHGLAVNDVVSVYGTLNNQLDGFYVVLSVPTSTTLTVAFVSAVALTSTGGLLYGSTTGPNTCVLANLYTAPYPSQFSAWGFYQQVLLNQTSFAVGSFSGTVASNATATIAKTVTLDLSINNQVTDDDLIVITLNVGSPINISNIRLQFDIAGSGYTSSYYYKDITPAYFQGAVAGQTAAYQATQSQILADTIGLFTGAPNTVPAQLQPGNISTGSGAWQTIYLRRGDFLPVGNAGNSGVDWINVTGWKLIINTNTSGGSTIAVNGIYLQWGYGPSSFGGIGYDWRYTYLNANTLTESSPCPIQNFDKQFGYLASLSAPIYLRQAAQQLGQYSTDMQVTHIRLYRRGGNLGSNWFQVAQFPNISAGGQFVWKDVVADAALIDNPQPLVLDNDPPVTASLVNPIQSNLAIATASPGQNLYATFQPQQIQMNATVALVAGQIVNIGNPQNLEQVTVISPSIGGGFFTAIVRLQHNAGEPVNVYSTPRTKCYLAALAYNNQAWLAGDPNNPHYLYFSKPGLPENFSPAGYIAVGSPQWPITAVVNWRGTLFVSTTKTWWVIVGGANPYAQPTGSIHGCVAPFGWTETEAAIWYTAADGLRAFVGADGPYFSLPVEWLFRQQAFGPVPLVDPANQQNSVMAFFNNVIYYSYVSLSNSGQRYRLNYDSNYRRFRSDDLGATAMLWEQDTNQFLLGIPVPNSPGNYCVSESEVYTQDYDDGGWVGTTLQNVPVALTIQTPYRDLSKPHYPKQWNVLELDVNTQGRALTSTLLFLTEPATTLPLASTTTSQRQKVQLQIEAGEGFQAYSAAIQHTMSVLTAPLLYQENIYAALLADYRSSFDTYWIKFGNDQSKVVKQGYFDYTSLTAITVELFADDGSGAGQGSSTVPYFTFTLPAQATRESVRVLYPAKKLRLWRLVMTSTGPFQLWSSVQAEFKPIRWGSTFSIVNLQGAPS